MLMTLLLFISGLSLSSISAVYAIAGLLAIFPAAPTTIIIMGSALEVSKLVIASWMYRNWNDIPKFLKTYFSIAIIVLMGLTSMSIFGYLSGAHTSAGIASGNSVASLQVVDEKITTQKENIAQSKKALAQMDSQVNEMMSRTSDVQGTDKAIRTRGLQKKERNSLNAEIAASQSEISKLQIERAPLAVAVRKVEADVGPIRYIANLIYGDNIDATILEKAVRWVILMIVFVFDPLAVLLLIAANWNLKHYAKIKTTITKRHIETIEDTTEETELLMTDNKDAQELSKIEEVKTEVPDSSIDENNCVLKSTLGCSNINEMSQKVHLDAQNVPKSIDDVIITSETKNEETILPNILHDEETEAPSVITPIDSDIRETKETRTYPDPSATVAIASSVDVDDYVVVRAPGAHDNLL